MCGSKLSGLHPFDNVAIIHWVKGALSGLKHFFATENPDEKMMKNVFYFTLKVFCSQGI